MSGIVLPVPEHPDEKVKNPTVQTEVGIFDLTLSTAFVAVLLRLRGGSGRHCEKLQYT